MAETSSFVASVFCYDQAIKHDIRLKIHSNEHIQYNDTDHEKYDFNL